MNHRPATASTAGVPSAVFVEIIRLLIVAFTTAAGFQLAGGGAEDAGGAAITGAILGASFGYVAGGILGRFLRRAMGTFETRVDRTPAAHLLAGTLGAIFLGGIAAAAGLGAIVALPGAWGWPLFGLVAWLGVYAGFQGGARKGDELAALLSRSSPQADRQARGTVAPPSASGLPLVLIDSSAAIDTRLLALADTGFLPGRLAVPRFVLDELQGIADAQDPHRRRLGRRALEALEALRTGSVGLVVLDDEVPEVPEVDAKLVALARRSRGSVLTQDRNLQRVASVQGVTCLDLNRLAQSLRPVLLPGEVVSLPISREGREPGQGVGFLEDGTMVVVTDGAVLLGREVEVRIASSVETAKGRMFFASPCDP